MIFNPVFTKRDTANPSAKAVNPSAVYTLIKIETPSSSSPTFYHTVEVISGNSGFRTFNSNDYLVSSMTGTPEGAASLINIPSGSISSTTIQGAINELAIEKAALSHTHDSIDILLANSGTLPSGTEVENLNNMLGYTGAPHSHIFPFNIWLKSAGMPGELMLELAKNNRADKLITPAMASNIRCFYNFAERNGLLTKNAGGINSNAARCLLPVFPSGYANANYINWLNPRDNIAIPKTSVGADNGIFVTPGGEMYQSASNGANIDAGGMTPRTLFDGLSTQITTGTPTSGATYVIIDNAGGADFTPAGAANNNLETYFTANGSGVTWGAGKLQKYYLPRHCLAYYSRQANAGYSDDNFWGGRDDLTAHNAGHRYFMTANSTNFRYAQGVTAGSYDVAHSSLPKGLIMTSFDNAFGYLTRQVKNGSAVSLLNSSGALAETYGAYNKTTPLRFFTYWNNGSSLSYHDRPASLLYAGLSFHKDTNHSLAIELADCFHNLAVAMAMGINPSWVQA